MQAWPFCAGVLARSVGGEGRLVKEDFPSTSVSSSAGFPRTESGEQSWPLVGGRPEALQAPPLRQLCKAADITGPGIKQKLPFSGRSLRLRSSGTADAPERQCDGKNR